LVDGLAGRLLHAVLVWIPSKGECPLAYPFWVSTIIMKRSAAVEK
jgi:hypothetical protein